uniref:CDP-diacylglycerol--inositol 3-phosphatidyltransferase n=1 Tax=Sus scrofa TaxID=9823 RepID=A0A8D0SPA8_PIG
MPGENIFLFVPNLIVMPGLSSPSFLSTSCPAAPSRPPPSTCSADFWTLLMDTLLESLIKVTDTSSQPASRPNNPLPPFPASSGTRFGAMLDMLTDRCSTMCLLVNLALLYPRATLLFQLSMSLDVASHWLHLHSSVVRGSESHKMIDLSGNPVLRIYYTSRPALFTLCAGNELFYCLLYLFNFSEGPLVGSVGLFRMGLWVTAPVALLKSLISVIHLITAARNMAALDAADRAKKK